jgi:hypothetical protein
MPVAPPVTKPTFPWKSGKAQAADDAGSAPEASADFE